MRRTVGHSIAEGVLPKSEGLWLYDRVPQGIAVRTEPVHLLKAIAKPAAGAHCNHVGQAILAGTRSCCTKSVPCNRGVPRRIPYMRGSFRGD